MKDGLYVNKNNKVWWLNGQRHREDGPAVEWSNGDKWWSLNNERFSYDEFILKTSKFWQQVLL